MAEARPIVCKALIEEVRLPGPDGGYVGFNRHCQSRSLHIRLKKGRIEHQLDQQNRLVEEVHEGVHVQFQNGVLTVDEETWKRAGMTREEAVAFLRAGEARSKYEVICEDPSDTRAPIPAVASKK